MGSAAGVERCGGGCSISLSLSLSLSLTLFLSLSHSLREEKKKKKKKKKKKEEEKVVRISLSLALSPSCGARFAIGGITEHVFSSLFAKRSLASIEKKNLFSFLFSCSYQLFKSHIGIEYIFFLYLSILFWLYIYLESSYPFGEFYSLFDKKKENSLIRRGKKTR